MTDEEQCARYIAPEMAAGRALLAEIRLVAMTPDSYYGVVRVLEIGPMAMTIAAIVSP